MENNSSSSQPPSPPERAQGTDSVSEWCCPICGDNEGDNAYLLPCHHRFCFPCAMRWLMENPNCSLCRAKTEAVLLEQPFDNFEDYLVFDIVRSLQPLTEDHQDEQEPTPGAQVGGFSPEVWADFFSSHPDLLRPLMSWVQRELMLPFQHQWWEASVGESIILMTLHRWGLDEAMLVRELHPLLGPCTQRFVHRLIATIMHLCGSEIQQYVAQQEPHTARREAEGPAASSSATTSQESIPTCQLASSSPACADGQEEGGTTETISGGPSNSPGTAIPAEQQQPQEEPDELLGAGPSTPGQDNRAAQHTRKRRAPRSQQSPRPCKRPACLELEGSPSQASLPESPGQPSSLPVLVPVPVPERQDQPQEEPEPVEEAGPSTWAQDHLPRAPKHTRKRMAPSSQDSPQPCKRPHRLQEEGCVPQASLHGLPGAPVPAPLPGEHGQPQEEPGDAMAQDPSGQGCSRSHSALPQDRDCSRGGTQHSQESRTPGLQDSPQPRKWWSCSCQ